MSDTKTKAGVEVGEWTSKGNEIHTHIETLRSRDIDYVKIRRQREIPKDTCTEVDQKGTERDKGILKESR